MKVATDLARLIRDYGPAFYEPETPEYLAALWVEALPNANFATIREWLDWGFWDPPVARGLSDAGVFPWEVPADTIYDLCSKNLEVSAFLQERS